MDSSLILIVDDDASLRQLLQRYLSKQGFQVAVTEDGIEMKKWLQQHDLPDLVVMDLMLPGEDGLSLTRYLKAHYCHLPVLILSAKGEDVDRIIGLEIGADDYLAKPFNPRELVARIRAVLRRPAPIAEQQDYCFGPYRLNLEQYVLYKNNQPLHLTAGEMALLAILVQHPNRLLSRDQLVDMIKGYDRSPFDRSIDVRIARLRQKIEEDPKNPRYIHTVWGKGYLFNPKGE